MLKSLMRIYILVIIGLNLVVAGVLAYATQSSGLEPDQRLKMTSAAQLDLSDGLEVLKNCPYLQKEFPAEAKEIDRVGLETSIVFLSVDAGSICAMAPPAFHTIFIFPLVWKEHSDGCYDGNDVKLLSHEFLHLLGLPPHKQYKDRSEYDLNDPIEIVISMCFGLGVK